MLLLNTKAASRPASVTIENLQDKKRVILANNIKMVEDPEDNGFVYNEVIFFMPDDRHETITEIEANFDAWWEFGKEDQKDPTIEERLTDLEELVLSIMEG